MNRSLPNVILGGFGTTSTSAGPQGDQEVRVHTEIDPAGSAEALRNADKVVIVPGYGMAVAQAGETLTLNLTYDLSYPPLNHADLTYDLSFS